MENRQDSSTVREETFWYSMTYIKAKNADMEELLFLRSLYKAEFEKAEQKLLAIEQRVKEKQEKN